MKRNSQNLFLIILVFSICACRKDANRCELFKSENASYDSYEVGNQSEYVFHESKASQVEALDLDCSGTADVLIKYKRVSNEQPMPDQTHKEYSHQLVLEPVVDGLSFLEVQEQDTIWEEFFYGDTSYIDVYNAYYTTTEKMGGDSLIGFDVVNVILAERSNVGDVLTDGLSWVQESVVLVESDYEWSYYWMTSDSSHNYYDVYTKDKKIGLNDGGDQSYIVPFKFETANGTKFGQLNFEIQISNDHKLLDWQLASWSVQK